MPKVVIYSKDYCSYCQAAKALLTSRGIPFEEKKLPMGPSEEFNALKKRTGMMTVPQIFAGDTLIGGFYDLSKLDAQDELASLKKP